MIIVQAIQAMRWVNFLVLLLAAVLAIEVYRQSRERSALLLMAALILMLLGSTIIPVYSAIMGLFMDPATQMELLRAGDGITWFTQIIALIGRGLLILAVIMLGRQRVRTGWHLQPRTRG